MLKCLPHSSCLSSSLSGLKTGTAQANGQIPQAAHSVNAVLEEAQRQVDTIKVGQRATDIIISNCHR